MTKEEAKQWIPLLQAFAEGKVIEYKGSSYDTWTDITEKFSFQDVSCYRIKPEPKYRLWKPEEVPVGKIIKWRVGTQGRYLITAASDNYIHVGSFNNSSRYTIYDIFTGCIMEDGSPCGVLE